MKLKSLSGILCSGIGNVQRAVVYDGEKGIDVENGCSIEYAVAHYGNVEVKRIRADGDLLVIII